MFHIPVLSFVAVYFYVKVVSRVSSFSLAPSRAHLKVLETLETAWVWPSLTARLMIKTSCFVLYQDLKAKRNFRQHGERGQETRSDVWGGISTLSGARLWAETRELQHRGDDSTDLRAGRGGTRQRREETRRREETEEKKKSKKHFQWPHVTRWRAASRDKAAGGGGREGSVAGCIFCLHKRSAYNKHCQPLLSQPFLWMTLCKMESACLSTQAG